MGGMGGHPLSWLRLFCNGWAVGVFYVVLCVAFLPLVVLEDGVASSWERLADNRWFVAASYIVAFLPWAVYSAIDHIDSQWRKMEDLGWKTRVAKMLCYISILQLLAYSVVQFVAEDWKEAMAAVVALAAAWLPLLRLRRQHILVASSRDLGNVLHSLPSFGGYSFWDDFRKGNYDNHEESSWSPGNSNKFFDNDDPGEGVTDVCIFGFGNWWSLHMAKGLLRRSVKVTKPVRADFFVGCSPQIALFYEKVHFYIAMDAVRSRLLIVAAGDVPRLYERCDLLRMRTGVPHGAKKKFLLGRLHWHYFTSWLMSGARSKPAKAAENGLTRSLWLYENLTGEGWLHEKRGKLAQVLHLGLVVHVGAVVVQGFAPEKLDWINVLVGPSQQDAARSKQGHHPAYGHLRTPGLLLRDWFAKGELKWFQKDDFDEVFAKLPTERSSLKENGHLRWEDVMFMVSSTIELHAFVEVMFGGLQLAAGREIPATIWKYICGAFVVNHCIHAGSSASPCRQETLHEAFGKLPGQYKSELEGALVKGPNAGANWNGIIVHCGNIVDVVTDALQREAPQGRKQGLMPQHIRGEDWRVQLTETRAALVGTLTRLLPSHGQYGSADAVDGSQNTDMGERHRNQLRMLQVHRNLHVERVLAGQERCKGRRRRGGHKLARPKVRDTRAGTLG